MALRVAGRYARALADVVGEKGEDYGRALEEVEAFGLVYRENAELREVLETPAVAMIHKLRILNAILGRLGTSFAVSNFFRVLVRNYRLANLEEISQAFRRIANERLGIVAVKIFSASELSGGERDALAARFEKLTGKRVEFEFHVDPNLVGGVRAQLGSTVYDGSVRGALERFREQLAGG